MNDKLIIRDLEIPPRIHGKVMRRVFLAGYGKYLALSTAVLALNLSVLGADLYRSLTTDAASSALRALRQGFAMTPSYLASVANTLYSLLPLQSLVATALTVALSAYVATMLVKMYRNPTESKLLRNVA